MMRRLTNSMVSRVQTTRLEAASAWKKKLLMTLATRNRSNRSVGSRSISSRKGIATLEPAKATNMPAEANSGYWARGTSVPEYHPANSTKLSSSIMATEGKLKSVGISTSTAALVSSSSAP